RKVVEHRQAIGLQAPSYHSVWRYCLSLPPKEVCLAREGRAAYLARYGLPPERRAIRPAPRPPRFRRGRRIAMVIPGAWSFFRPVRSGVATAQMLLEHRGTRVDWIVAAQGAPEGVLAPAVERATKAGYDAIGVVALGDE